MIGRGRDALDVAMVTTYGSPNLKQMTVWADEAKAEELSSLGSPDGKGWVEPIPYHPPSAPDVNR